MPSKPSIFHAAAVETLNSGISLWQAEKLFRDAVEMEALNRARGHQLHAARLLGVHRNTFGRGLDGSLARRKRKAARAIPPAYPRT